MGRKSGSFAAALMLMAVIMPLPIGASIITAAIHISRGLQLLITLQLPLAFQLGREWMTIVAGLLITLVLWLVLALFTRQMTTIENVNSLSAIHLKNHLYTLQAAFLALPKPSSNTSGTSSQREDQQQYHLAYGQVQAYIHHLEEEMGYKDERWVTARGYLNAWKLLHRAEEAMIVLQPDEEVLREAWHDEMSLEGCAMESKDAALKKLRTAVKQLSASAAIYLDKPDDEADSSEANVVPAGGNATSPMSASSTEAAKAREALRDVRQTLNEYRGGLWEGLVSQRNQLISTAFITGLFTYTVLGFAIIARAFPTSIEAATAFYLAGALVGLFSRLYSESQVEKSVDDFNLSLVRILITPVISGLAAVGGVLLLASLTLTLTKPSIGQSVLANSFDLQANTLGIVIAAIFGYAPNLFINALQERAKEVTTQLQNSTAPNQGSSDQGTSGKGTAGKAARGKS